MHVQLVQLIGIRQRHFHRGEFVFQFLQALDFAAERVRQGASVQFAVDLAQVLVPAVDARADTPLVDRPDGLEQRDHHHDQRDQQDDVAVGQRGDAKRQVALQNRQPLGVVMPGILVQLEGARLCAGEGAGGVEQGAAAHHFTAGFEKQRYQARVEVVVDHQGSDWREGDDVAIRRIAGQVEQTFTDLHLIEERQSRLVSGGAPKVCQGDVRVGRQLLNQCVLCRTDEERCIQFAGHQRPSGFATAEALPGVGILFWLDGIGAENGITGGAGAAAFAAQAEAQRQQVGNAIQLNVTAIEQPQRLLIDRPQALQLTLFVRRQLALQAALHQGDLHLGRFGEQALQVVTRARGGHQGKLETFLGQFFLQSLGKVLIGAALRAGGHADTHRWWRRDELEQRPDQRGHHRHDPQVGQDHDFQVIEYAAHEASFRQIQPKDRTHVPHGHPW